MSGSLTSSCQSRPDDTCVPEGKQGSGRLTQISWLLGRKGRWDFFLYVRQDFFALVRLWDFCRLVGFGHHFIALPLSSTQSDQR